MTTISMTYEGCNYRLGIYSWNMSEQCYYWICEAEAERFKDMTIFRTTQGNQQCHRLTLMKSFLNVLAHFSILIHDYNLMIWNIWLS